MLHCLTLRMWSRIKEHFLQMWVSSLGHGNRWGSWSCSYMFLITSMLSVSIPCHHVRDFAIVSQPRRISGTRIFVDLSPKSWTMLGVCLNLVSITTLSLEIPPVVLMMEMAVIALVRLRISVELFVEYPIPLTYLMCLFVGADSSLSYMRIISLALILFAVYSSYSLFDSSVLF